MPSTRGKGHALGQAEPGVQLGAVEPEGRDLDQHLPGVRDRHREVADLQRLRRSGASSTTAFIVDDINAAPTWPAVTWPGAGATDAT